MVLVITREITQGIIQEIPQDKVLETLPQESGRLPPLAKSMLRSATPSPILVLKIFAVLPLKCLIEMTRERLLVDKLSKSTLILGKFELFLPVRKVPLYVVVQFSLIDGFFLQLTVVQASCPKLNSDLNSLPVKPKPEVVEIMTSER